MVFRSKIDIWLLIVLLASVAAVLFSAAHVLRAGAGWLAPLLLVLVGAGLPLWLLVSTQYTIESETLIIRSGPFAWRINVQEIVGLTRTRSAISSPALSLDRIHIEYKSNRFSRSVLVSPKDKSGFLKAIRNAQAEAIPST